MNNDIERILYSQEEIATACERLGKEITNDYQDKTPVVVSVLSGAVFITTDVLRQMDVYTQLAFIDVSSYNGGTASSGKVRLVTDITQDVADRDVLIIEDIVDTGRTLKYIIDLLKQRHAKSVRVCTLLDKPTGRVLEVKADYVGFEVPDEFVVGYGLDYKGEYRNLPYVGVLKPKIYLDK
ncbi:hypoxanthine phosphoribosyltransferase [Pediococcus inopinatus]|uniref:Hypoxanthine phosphoribosyltransferase n=1 Tax=Pediococcus inopinatus TaxID=114090 RepID=A0ABZ0Q374_9LACO|nr:hypoxanthine phosphoribosyltransferase [Pediococcus inopinatus]AVL00516.1 hypoxanthine phosphoribosyltransferase [Pediococcus inopinatus]KRN61242.1 hypoxanthine-guanine phosphoribosyltransferase [Pediococcus inopinatus]WPC18171.1 hypoxanthine phosphoribosyltransferase [Pediococcus inopinatus]WPC19714.1 hypoxanthine phosphoribosyltransferase [Pediococcus inopinatus]WPC21410.1 hypoxanthine phosphoribosyltransferase [Pediococcus inopinatus]